MPLDRRNWARQAERAAPCRRRNIAMATAKLRHPYYQRQQPAHKNKTEIVKKAEQSIMFVLLEAFHE